MKNYLELLLIIVCLGVSKIIIFHFLPLFDYCCTVWGETTNLNLEKLYKLQKRAARIILNAKYDIPSLQLF